MSNSDRTFFFRGVMPACLLAAALVAMPTLAQERDRPAPPRLRPIAPPSSPTVSS